MLGVKTWLANRFKSSSINISIDDIDPIQAKKLAGRKITQLVVRELKDNQAQNIPDISGEIKTQMFELVGIPDSDGGIESIYQTLGNIQRELLATSFSPNIESLGDRIINIYNLNIVYEGVGGNSNDKIYSLRMTVIWQ